MSSYDGTAADDANRRSKRRIAVIAVSSVALLALVITVIVLASRGRRDYQIDSADSSNLRSDENKIAIMAICNGTVYPDSCYSSLSQLSNDTELHPVKIYQASLWFAMSQVRLR